MLVGVCPFFLGTLAIYTHTATASLWAFFSESPDLTPLHFQKYKVQKYNLVLRYQQNAAF